MILERVRNRPLLAGILALALFGMAGSASAQDRVCERVVSANVVAFHQTIWLNRLGANLPGGMMYALARDVVDQAGNSCDNGVGSNPPTKASCQPGKVRLRPGKRPRPIVLRANEGDCLQIAFTNLLGSTASAGGLNALGAEPAEDLGPTELPANRRQRLEAERQGKLRPPQKLRAAIAGAEAEADAASDTTLDNLLLTSGASVHVQGLPWVNGPQDDGSNVGSNPSSLVAPGKWTTYKLFAEHEGSYILYSAANPWTNPTQITANTGGADGGTLAQGLFGSVNVQPSESDVKPYGKKWDSEWYRSQVTEQDLCLASKNGFNYSPASGCTRTNPDAPLQIDYQALYPANYQDKSRANLPILNMLCNAAAVQKGACAANELVHSDLTAVITGPNAGHFPSYIKPANQPPALRAIAVLPDRLQPYRELTIIYHESFTVQQAFPNLYTSIASLGSAADNFGINYGFGGIISEILANRIGVGPVKDCSECKYEEFFLSSWALGDPAMVVDVPATACVDANDQPIPGCKATVARFPDDPSNVYQSYIGDHIRFRVLHGGSDLHHVHHQHAHQWLHTSNSPTGDYTDSQSIGPGSSFTMEMTYYGGGNLNQTVGDSIFHCHFYAHFASGMWSLLRVFDTLQMGTVLAKDGKPATGSRALPDGEIVAGTPIPAVVPMPTLPMAPRPAPVRLTAGGTRVEVQLVDANTGAKGDWVSALTGGDPGKSYLNPGYPFFIPGVGGRRAPHPPLDFAYACSDNGMRCSPGTAGEPKDVTLCQNPGSAKCDPLDGGLPRHLITGGTASMPAPNETDFSKILEESDALQLAEQGTMVEKIAMGTHAKRLHNSCRPDGKCDGICSDNGAPCTPVIPPDDRSGLWQCGNPATATCVEDPAKPVTYVLNGLPAKPGAPYADPCVKFDRNGGPAPDIEMRRYLAADIQLDALFNKEGWHFPQQRMISLWSDVKDFQDRKRPPEPLFFRANSNDCIEYTLANLVSNIYELDEFQVRTPTDILGQHIHLVKFDVTSSDGAGNGWNYEDGTFAPNEVTERIHSINAEGGIDLQYVGGAGRQKLAPKPIQFFGNGPGGTWIGAQATIQRWYSDPIWDNFGACSTNPDELCTLTDLSKCSDKKATCDVTAGFCSTDFNKACTASTAVNRCGATGECISKHDRTLRTVFTHDHFGPSTHQQAGLYAGLVIEPKGSQWRDNQTGEVFGGFDPGTGQPVNKRFDGGPTSWQAVIETRDQPRSYREFLLELQDSTLMYQPFPVRAFDLGDGATAKSQFAQGSYDQFCGNREPWEPCGFCGNDGVCVDTATGLPAAPVKTCLVPVPGSTSNPCGSTTQACRLVLGQLKACLPEKFTHCQGKSYGDSAIQPTDAIKSCKLISGIPGIAWGTTPIDKPGGVETITFFGATTNFSFNYRNEPLYQRTTDPFSGAVLSGQSGDLSYAYSSNSSIVRPNPRGAVCSNNLGKACSTNADCPQTGTTDPCDWAGLCSDNFALCTPANKSLCGNPQSATCQGSCDARTDANCVIASPYPPLTPGVQPGDPFTPLLRAYSGDDVQVRTLTGAHLNPHNFTMQGLNWLLEPSFVDSGWRNSEVMGISEHFELITRVPANAGGASADFLYQPGAAAIEQAGGNWGLFRAYSQRQNDLYPLPQNATPPSGIAVCPTSAKTRSYNVVAVNVPVTYNSTQGVTDNSAIVFYRCPAGQALATCKPPSNWKPEPLVLRAGAGECIKVQLYNAIPAATAVAGNKSPASTLPYNCGTACTAAQSTVSNQVGFRPQLVAFDPRTSGGVNSGLNPITSGSQVVQTAGPGQTVSYTWYAGNIDTKATTHDKRYIPVEFGASNLMTPDVMNHYFHSLIGGLVIEPAGSKGWETAGTTALVTMADGTQFREFVVFTQDNLNIGGALEGVNYGTEILAFSAPLDPVRYCQSCPTKDFGCVVSATSSLLNGTTCTATPFTPSTPTFKACAGESVRFRLLHPGGINTDQVFEIYGHNWSEAPYMTAYDHCQSPTTHTNLWASQRQGTTNLCANQPYTLSKLSAAAQAEGEWQASLNAWQGSRMGHGPGNHVDVLIARAGGPYQQPGSYLYRSYPAMHYQLGMWGWFNVLPKTDPMCKVTPKPDSSLKNQWRSGGGQ